MSQIQLQEMEDKFIKNNLEKTLRLLQILNEFSKNENLQDDLVLKGGCAIEVYLKQMKRLFSDIDLDYKIKNMHNIEEERNLFYNQLLFVMRNLQYNELSPKSRHSYSLDSFCFPYYNQVSNLDYVKIEINYSYGEHLYAAEKRVWDILGTSFFVNVLSLEELIGMKLKALVERSSIKDLFDIYAILEEHSFKSLDRIRKAYLFYFTISSLKNVTAIEMIDTISKKDMISKLYPAIAKKSFYNLEVMKKEVIDFALEVFRFTKEEMEFYRTFQNGKFYPELLFNDEVILKKALSNPIANFKIELNKRYKK